MAFIAAECEPWAKTGGLADVVDALARALGRARRRRASTARRRVPAALPRRAGAPDASARTHARRSRTRGRGRARPRCTILDVASRRLSAAPRRPPAGVRPRRAVRHADRRPPGQRLAVRAVCAAPRSRRCGPTSAPLDVHPHPRLARRAGAVSARRLLSRRPGRSAARRSSLTLHNLAYHGWTRERRASPELGLRPATRCAGAERRRDRPAARRHRARRDRQHGRRPGSPRGADARVRHGPRRPAARARATGSSGSSTGSTRTSGIRRRTRRWPRRTLAADPSARPPAAPTCSTRIGIDPDDPGRSSG